MMKITTTKNPELDDDKFVEECMELLRAKYPEISGYMFERVGEKVINLMMWGEDLYIVKDI